MDDTPLPTQLNYAPEPENRPVRHPFRWAAIIVAIAILALSPQWAPAVWQHLQLLGAQRLCENYTAPAEQIVYESDPAAVRKLLATSSHCTAITLPAPPNTQVAVHIPSQYWSFYRLLNSSQPNTHGTVFMHQRLRPDGSPRLVFVDAATVNLYSSGNEIYFYIRVLRPGTLLRPPAEVTYPAISTIPAPLKFGASRLFAGQVDEKNSSHFTIAYVSANVPGIIDGYLHDDDSVTLEPRREAAASKPVAKPASTTPLKPPSQRPRGRARRGAAAD